MTAPTVDIRRADDRAKTKIDWLDSKHSFSFGHHYDPRNVGHGLLIVNNDDVVQGGTGFSTHPHRDMEIVTWVLSGELEHKDSERNRGVIYPGLAQRMSAGTGIWHSETNNSGVDDVHFVQMWVLPDTESIDPGYEQLDINAELAKGGPDDIAMIAYTSGTTGNPKGAMLSHRNMIAAAEAFIEVNKTAPGDNWLSYLPMAWVGDAAFSIGMALAGKMVSNCPEGPESVQRDLRELGPHAMLAPPRIWESMLTTMQVKGGDGGVKTLWVAADSRQVPKVSITLPAMNGAVLTAELQP